MGELPVEGRKRRVDEVGKADEREWKVDEEDGQDGDVKSSEFGLRDTVS